MSIDTTNRRLGPWDSLGFIIDAIDGLENTNVKCTWFESVASGLSGTITPPTGGTIVLNEWSAGVDVLVSKIDTGVPTFEPVLDDEGAVITGTLDAAGAWTISGTPDDGYPISLIYVYRVTLENFSSVYCLSAAQIEGINTLSFLGNLTDNITGFTDEGRAQSTIAFDEGTLTFTITPVGDKYSVWILGKEFVYTSVETKVISSTEGAHWIYFDSTGTIQELVNPTEAQEKTAILQTGLIAQILIDNASQEIYFADERHGVSMSGWTHLYLHETIGFKYYEGLGPGNLQVDGSGNDNASAVMSIADGELYDEDLKYETSDSPQTLAPIASIPVYYIDGVAGSWRKDTATDYPVKRFGTSRLAYNAYSAPNYSQAIVGNNNFVLCHIFATNDIDEPIIAVQGIEAYANANFARLGAEVEITFINTDGLPGHEFTALFTFIYQTSDSYSNAVQARIVHTDTGDDYIDWRQAAVSAGSGSGGGDVTGPSSATDNAMALFDGVTGKVIKESALTITTGVIAGTGLALTSPIINTILSAATKNGITITEDGAVTLYFNELVKLATTATGATITGELVAGQVTGLNAPDAAGEAVRTTTNITEVNLLALTGGGETALHSHALAAGDVVGPGSAVDNAVALFDSTTGKLIKESAITITSGVIAGVGLALTSPIINTILTAATKTGATFAADGAATLYYNELVKLATSANGATITGLLEIDKLPADDTGSGIAFTADVDTNTVGIGGVLLLGADGSFDDGDASAEATAGGMLVMACAAGTGNTLLLTRGTFQDAGTWDWTPGAILYLSETAGQLTETPPSTSTSIVRIMGYALTADSIFFDPDKTYIEVT